MNKSNPAYTWFLERFPEEIVKLKRDQRETDYFNAVGLPAQIDRLRLFVPRGLQIYQVVKQLRTKGHLFFCVREFDGASGQSYLSVVEDEKKLDDLEWKVNLLNCPWFNAQDTNYIFNRILKSGGNAVFWGKGPNAFDPHPFLEERKT